MPKSIEEQKAEYAAQVKACVQALALANNSKVASYVVGEKPVEQLNLFTEGNLEKRFQKLNDQLDELHDVVEGLEDIIAEYVKTVPLAAYDTGSSDGVAFLDWWETKQVLSLEQRDYSLYVRGRYEVECLGSKNRIAHVHFQELAAMNDRVLKEMSQDSRMWIHLNPVRHVETFSTTVLLDDEADLPATIVFFPVENNVHLAVLEDDAKKLIAELELVLPIRVNELLAQVGSDGPLEMTKSDLMEMIQDLAQIGVIAFG